MNDHSKHEAISTLIVEEEIEGGYAIGPERSLLSALLFDGVQSYLAFCLTDAPHTKARYQEAYFWVHQKDPEYVFSFDNVCDALGIDANNLRLGIQNFVNSNQIDPEREGFRRSRRHS